MWLYAVLTIDVFLLWWNLLFGGGFADKLGQSLTSQTVFSRVHPINKALSSHIWTVQKLIYTHCAKINQNGCGKCLTFNPRGEITAMVAI